MNGLANGPREGRVNGARRGRTNGAGRVNGITNGRVNGLGYTNGLTLRQNRFGLLTQRDLVAGTRLLVVAVASMLALPALFLTQSAMEEVPITVDGDLADWAGHDIQVEGTKGLPLEVTASAVTPYAGAQFWMVRTAGPPFADGVPRSYLLSIDADADPATGLVVDDLGVDYLIDVSGYDGQVHEASLLAFDPDAGLDVNRRTTLGYLTAESGPEGFELRSAVKDLLPSTEFRARIMAVDGSGRAFSARTTLSSGSGSLVVTQRSLPVNGTSGDVLALDFTAFGSGVDVTGLRFAAAGGGRLVAPATPFRVEPGSPLTRLVGLDRSGLPAQSLVRLELASVQASAPSHLEGDGALFYTGPAPSVKVVDGLFSDWAQVETDARGEVAWDSADLTATASDRDAFSVFFYASTEGAILLGRDLPFVKGRPQAAGEPGEPGGKSAHIRKTGEDVVRVYVDTDSAEADGEPVDGVVANKMVEIRGVRGRVTERTLFTWNQGRWDAGQAPVLAEARGQALEASVSLASLGPLRSPEVVIATTGWQGEADVGELLATLPSTTRGSVPVLPSFGGAGDNQFLVTAAQDLALDNAAKQLSLRHTARTTIAVQEFQVYVASVFGFPPLYDAGIQGDDGLGNPNGLWLCMSTVSPAATGWYAVPCLLLGYTAGTVYHLVMKYNSGGIGGGNHIRIRTTTPNNQMYPVDQSADLRMTVLYDPGTGWGDLARQPVFVVDDFVKYVGNPYHSFLNQVVRTTTGAGNKFQVSWTETYNQARFTVRKVGSPSGDLFLKIRDVAAGVELVSARVSSASIGSAFSTITWAFSSVTLNPLTTYAIYLEASTGTDLTNYYLTPISLAVNLLPYTDLTYDKTVTFATRIDLSCGLPPCFTDSMSDDVPFQLLPEMDVLAAVAMSLGLPLIAFRRRGRRRAQNG